MRLARALLIGAVAINLSLVSPVLTAVASDSPIAGDGTWTLAQLGSPNLVLTGERLRASAPVTMPSDAKQGSARWWHIFLHARVDFSDQASGVWYLTGRINGAASASIEFDLDHSPRGKVKWNAVDVDGEARYLTPGRAVEVEYSNVVGISGIRPGRGSVSFDMEQIGGSSSSFERATIDAARTGLQVNHVGPNPFQVSVIAPHRNPARGSPFSVSYSIANSGPPAKLTLRVMATPGVQLQKSSQLVLGSVAHQRSGSISFLATAAGDQRIFLGVANDRGKVRASQEIGLTVVDASHGKTAYLVIAGAVLVLVVGVVLVRSRRR